MLGCAACIAACCVTYTLATRLTTAANAVVLQYTSPVFILYLWVFFHQRPRRLDLAACGVVFAGMACCFAGSLSGGGMWRATSAGAGGGVDLCGGVYGEHVPGGRQLFELFLEPGAGLLAGCLAAGARSARAAGAPLLFWGRCRWACLPADGGRAGPQSRWPPT